MPDKSNTASKQLDNTLVRGKIEEERKESEKIEQKIQEEEKTQRPQK